MVHEILKETKAKIFWTKSGKEAINFLKKDPIIDLVLMDYNLPCINGIETIKQLLQIKPELTIIGLTLKDCKNEFIESGAKGFILKPIIKENLMQLLNKFLN